ncbi:hypothetical protein ACLQ2Q_13495 [Microbacterium sp. DT81.1]|uniref:hypothetical protein n=1 Tax=Microbacterium sp. DT81.1 TaxID=3393413 RepID=UPI003CF20130
MSGFFGPLPTAGDEAPLTVTGPSQVPLHIAPRGMVSFDIANLTARPVRARVSVDPIAGAELSWFDIEGGTRRDIPVGGQATVEVSVQVPGHAPPGTASFRFVAALEEDPSQATKSPTVQFTVPKRGDGPRRWIVVVLAAALALTAVAAIGILTFGLIRDDDEPPAVASSPAAAWLENGGAVAIVTWGDGSCTPALGDSTLWDSRFVVELMDPVGEECSGESVPRPTLAPLTEPLALTEELEIVLAGDYEGVIRLAGDPEPPPEVGFAEPSAGWYSPDGFVLLTWGSSSCPPEVASTEVTAEDEVTVVFVASGESPCTADLARRATIAEVDEAGLGDGRVTAILQGDGSDDIEVPIAGVRQE